MKKKGLLLRVAGSSFRCWVGDGGAVSVGAPLDAYIRTNSNEPISGKAAISWFLARCFLSTSTLPPKRRPLVGQALIRACPKRR